MPVGDLRKLWNLHLIDEALHGIRSRAGALDPGRKIIKEIDALQAACDEIAKTSTELHSEQTDLELKQASISEKMKKIEKSLYGGMIISPREVEAYQKEIEMLRKQRSEMDDRLLELIEIVGPAQAETDKAKKLVDAKKAELQQYQKQIVVEKSRLEGAYKEASAQRAFATAEVPPVLLNRYEPIVKKHGTGMARITKGRSCEACGLQLGEKIIEMVKDERPVPCEACHRILYFSEGLV